MAFSGESTVGEIIDNEAAKAVLEKHMPGFSNHPQIDMGRSMTLTAVAGFAEAGISADVLAAIIEDLGKLDEG